LLHARPEYLDYVDTRDGTPPSTAQLVVAADHPAPNTPKFWLNWDQVRLSLRPVHRGRGAQSGPVTAQADCRRATASSFTASSRPATRPQLERKSPIALN